MPASSSASRATETMCRVSRSREKKPWEVAPTPSELPICTVAPSELLIRGSCSRPAASQRRARSVAASMSICQGCQRSRSGKSCASRSASARPLQGSASVWRAMAQACSMVFSIESGLRSAVLAEEHGQREPAITIVLDRFHLAEPHAHVQADVDAKAEIHLAGTFCLAATQHVRRQLRQPVEFGHAVIGIGDCLVHALSFPTARHSRATRKCH